MDLWPSGMIMLTKHEYTPTITGMLSSTNKQHIIMKSTKVQTLNAVIRHNSDMSWLCNYSACMPSLKMQPTVHRETLSAELLKYAFFDETTSLARSYIPDLPIEITCMRTQGNYRMRVIFIGN